MPRAVIDGKTRPSAASDSASCWTAVKAAIRSSVLARRAPATKVESGCSASAGGAASTEPKGDRSEGYVANTP